MQHGIVHGLDFKQPFILLAIAFWFNFVGSEGVRIDVKFRNMYSQVCFSSEWFITERTLVSHFGVYGIDVSAECWRGGELLETCSANALWKGRKYRELLLIKFWIQQPCLNVKGIKKYYVDINNGIWKRSSDCIKVYQAIIIITRRFPVLRTIPSWKKSQNFYWS